MHPLHKLLIEYLPGPGVLVTACLLVSTASAQAQLPPGIQLVVDGHNLPADSYSLLVHEVSGTEALLEVNPTLPMNPASTIKVLTTLAALEVLGPAFTWHTEIYALGPVVDGTLQGDLLIKGGGDPYLLEEQFRNLLKALRVRGIERIDGDLVIDARFFDASVAEEMAIDNQAGRTYNVMPHALSVNFQAVTFYFSPAANGRDVVIKTDPLLPNLQITNRLRQKNGACTGYQRGISFSTDPARPGTVIFDGEFPSRCNTFAMARAALDPAQYTWGLFRQLWRELGGEFDGALRLEATPDEVEPLLRWESPPLAEVIRYLNKYSNNLMARHMLLTLAAEMNIMPATVTGGSSAIQEYLDAWDIDSTGLVIANGSGLSRDSRLTTQMLNQVLLHGYESRYMPEFISSLPVAGEDGTMRNRLRDGSNRGYMHIKTGTLDEVSAVAGYVQGQSGKYYAVTGILNHELADRGPGVELMDALLRWVRQQ